MVTPRRSPKNTVAFIDNYCEHYNSLFEDMSAPGGEVKSQKLKVLNPLATNETSTFLAFAETFAM